MQNEYFIWGTFKDSAKEQSFLQQTWIKNKGYGFLSYFLCCLFFVFAGIFGDFQREFFSYGAWELLGLRIILLFISLSFYLFYRKQSLRPRNVELWMDSMKYLSTIIIILLTIWTKGSSLTLLPGIMMMVASFYIMLPGRIHSTNICALMLLFTFAFWQDPNLTYGVKVHHYMTFMLFAIETLLFFFKCKMDRWARLEYDTQMQLDDINRTKDKILATIAHDIRNPLAIIHSKAEMSKIKLDRNDLVGVKDQQLAIIKSVLKLDKLLLDIIEWALSELQLGKSSKDKFCIKETVERAVNFVSEQAELKKIKFKMEVDSSTFPLEGKLMETCFRNILTNAIKFSPASTKVEIHGKRIGDHYTLKFADEGSGMDKVMIENLLNGLNHDSEPGTEGEMGTGFGLKLVKNIIHRHDGEMKIDSIIGKGTTFTFHLPVGLESA